LRELRGVPLAHKGLQITRARIAHSALEISQLCYLLDQCQRRLPRREAVSHKMLVFHLALSPLEESVALHVR
jgi:hypothetical protein